jgi:hypothetical protein
MTVRPSGSVSQPQHANNKTAQNKAVTKPLGRLDFIFIRAWDKSVSLTSQR